MSFRTIDGLTSDQIFAGRIRACAVQQAGTFRSDDRPDIVAVATDVLRGGAESVGAFVRIIAAFPGLADGAETEHGYDQSLIGDPDLLAQVQANWPVVAELLFADDGSTRSP